MTTIPPMPTLRPDTRSARAYYGELRALLAEHRDAILEAFEVMRSDQGITVSDVCALALRFELRLHGMFMFLEDENKLPCGTYDRVKAGGIKPLAALAQVWAEMNNQAVE